MRRLELVGMFGSFFCGFPEKLRDGILWIDLVVCIEFILDLLEHEALISILDIIIYIGSVILEMLEYHVEFLASDAEFRVFCEKDCHEKIQTREGRSDRQAIAVIREKRFEKTYGFEARLSSEFGDIFECIDEDLDIHHRDTLDIR